MSVNIGRLSTVQLAQLNREFISRTTLALQEAGKEVSTGKKADLYADIGPRAAASLTLRARENETQAYITTNTLLQGKLQAQLNAVDSVRTEVLRVLDTVLANASSPLAGAETLQLQAQNALGIAIAQLNLSFNGEALFGGTRTQTPPLTQWTQINPNSGLSPEGAVQSILTGPPTDITQMQSMLVDLQAAFDSNLVSNPGANFETTFYSGTPLLDATGQPSPRVSARIEPGLELAYGVQANDAPFREVIRGLAMLAAFDVTSITNRDTYVAWMNEVAQALGNGGQAALSVSAEIGFRQQSVETASKRLEALSLVNQTQIGDLESVDPYEAATRLTSLQNQLRASYEVTAQLNRLSLLDYL